MKALGTLQLKGDTSFRVYVSVIENEVFFEHDRRKLEIAQGYVNVQYSGVYAGTIGQLNQHIYSEVAKYLINNGYVIRNEPEDLFAAPIYTPTHKLLDGALNQLGQATGSTVKDRLQDATKASAELSAKTEPMPLVKASASVEIGG